MSSPTASTTHCSFREIYLETDSESFDLHNSFDFVGFSYDAAKRTVTLRWIPNQYVSPDQRHPLIVEMRGVFHLSSSARDPELPFSEDACLNSVGLIPPSAPTLDSVQENAPADWHHVFEFTSGFMLRIGAESVCLLPNDI
jgi:hypothetical protein